MGASAIIRKGERAQQPSFGSSIRLIRTADGAGSAGTLSWWSHVDTICAPAHPRRFRHARSKDEGMILEIAVIVISVVGFVILDFYVLGCEKV